MCFVSSCITTGTLVRERDTAMSSRALAFTTNEIRVILDNYNEVELQRCSLVLILNADHLVVRVHINLVLVLLMVGLDLKKKNPYRIPNIIIHLFKRIT